MMLKSFVISIISLCSFMASVAGTREQTMQASAPDLMLCEGRADDTGDISSMTLTRQLDMLRGPQTNARAVEQHGFLDALPPFFEKFSRGGSPLAKHYLAARTPILRLQLQLIYPHHGFW